MAKGQTTWIADGLEFGFKIDSTENVKKAVRLCMNVPLMLAEGVEAGTIVITCPSIEEAKKHWERRPRDPSEGAYERVWLQPLLRAAAEVRYPLEQLYNEVMEELPLCPVTTHPVIYYLATHMASPEWKIYKYYEYGKLCEKYGLKPGTFTGCIHFESEDKGGVL